MCFIGKKIRAKFSKDGSLEKKLRELLGNAYYVTKKKSRDEKTRQQPWQQHHGKAKDFMRHEVQDEIFTSILDRFQNDLSYKESLLVHGWNETWCKYLDYIRTIDSSNTASRAQRERYAKMWRFKSASTNYQLGPMRMRSDNKEATERVTSFAIREGQSVKHIPKEERHRIDALDPDLEKWLIWLSENMAHLFCQRRNTIKLRFVYFLELQLVDWKFQMVLEWRWLERT